MKLTYYKDPVGNFGDDLNPWLWDQLLPGAIDHNENTVLIGVGTLLDQWFIGEIPEKTTKVVLGSGGGMMQTPPTLDSSWRVYGVRGPLTASYLGLSSDLALADPAMCLRRLWRTPPIDRAGVGFMPHHKSTDKWDWAAVCRELGLVYVDPHGAPLETIAQIGSLERLVTEAMHGAIVADALRTPWIAVRINPYNYTGKWDDWGSSLGLPIHFEPLPDLYDPVRAGHSRSSARAWAKHHLKAHRPFSRRWERVDCLRKLSAYATRYEPQLSRDGAIETALDRFHIALETLREDWRKGVFCD